MSKKALEKNGPAADTLDGQYRQQLLGGDRIPMTDKVLDAVREPLCPLIGI